MNYICTYKYELRVYAFITYNIKSIKFMSYDLFFYKFGFKIFPRGISSFLKILNNVVNYKDLLRELHKNEKTSCANTQNNIN